jgi:uncharacterized protein (TIGR02118 family)
LVIEQNRIPHRMARMIVIYAPPDDPAAFDDHYFNGHIPLAKMIPGMRKYEVSSGKIVTLAGSKETYLISSLYFDSLDAIKTAFATEVGTQCAADRRILQPDDEKLQMFLMNDREV